MRITFYRCDRSWASIASKNVSHPRVSAAAARREFEVRSRCGLNISRNETKSEIFCYASSTNVGLV